MSKTVEVPALCAFTYNGRQVVEGEMVSMAPLEAAAHARRRHVSLAKGIYGTRALRAKPQKMELPSEPEPVKSRRRYRRRDLQAEE